MTKPKVLLVESSSIALQIQKRILKDLAVTVVTASDGEEAFKVVRRVLPDLVYLSFSLTGMDGAACCKILKKDPVLAGIPVIMMCASSGDEERACRAAGCDAVISRPVDRREFLEAGQVLLSRSPRTEEAMPCRATVSCSGDAGTFFGSVEDISTTGMFVGAPQVPLPGDLLTMKFVLPWSGAVLIETDAEVIWVNSGRRRRSGDYPVGFRVRFRDLKPDALEHIQDFMELTRVRLPWR